MNDVEAYPTQDLIKELMRRFPDVVLLYTYEDESVKDGELLYEFCFNGDAGWLRKRLQREVIPRLRDEEEDQEYEEEED